MEFASLSHLQVELADQFSRRLTLPALQLDPIALSLVLAIEPMR